MQRDRNEQDKLFIELAQKPDELRADYLMRLRKTMLDETPENRMRSNVATQLLNSELCYD